MLTRAHGRGARRQSSFPRLSKQRIERQDKGSQSVAANTLLARDLIRSRRCVLNGERQAQWRIERTGISDAKKRASYPLAKRAGARCAF